MNAGNDKNNTTYLSKDRIGISNHECVRLSDSSVFLIRGDTAERVKIVDGDGAICNFPGVETCEALLAERGNREIPPVVKYSATFKRCKDGQYLMIWTIRPDGRFWADSWGFGAEDDESIELYSYIDETGHFTAPFRLYSIGCRNFIEHVEAL